MATAEEIKAAATAATAPAAPVAEVIAGFAELEAARAVFVAEKAAWDAKNNPQVEIVGERTYFTLYPNSCFYITRQPGSCEQVRFVGNRLTTSDAVTAAWLEKVVDQPGTGIYSDRDAAMAISAEAREVATDMAAIAAASHTKMIAAGEKVG